MKNSLTKLHKGKKTGLSIVLFVFIFFLYQQIKQFFLSYFIPKEPDRTFSIQQEVPVLATKQKELTYSIEIADVSFEQLRLLATNDYNSPIFEKNGIKYEIFYQDNQITHLQLSPDQKKLGFYLHSPEEDTVFGKTSLVIMDIEKRNFKEISEGDLRVSNWEWKNNSQFIIYIDCGTGCHLAHLRSVTDGQFIASYLDKKN